MPHYKDGTIAKHGDLIMRREKHESGTWLVGIIAIITAGSDSCNAQVQPLAIRQKGAMTWLPIMNNPPNWYVTLSECEKLGEEMPMTWQPSAPLDPADAADRAAMASG